ncbi:hypothetical protein [Phaeobacter gallaeciensis]|uniref:hypothetical protein n=1 Tax=Phaeobacter gallaeciensis TaxID=60890 RepID=UPI000BBCECF7|nr:hypothetical protein [Phaeobacter gallaeciensis]ATF17108.1 hypothetical protein PhaeoP129_00447 [Phaeobacter gallaeciensis]ATF21217.1 hypothetical protein PhaeoP128_00447 [Phaeobacter gallaeciensis]
MPDPEQEYGEIAVRCILADGQWRHLPWPAYEATAMAMVKRGDIEATESIWRTAFRLPSQST